ncbi:MAG TPA: hypothetical protein VGL75_18955 [Acidothermaceae bacterium]
MSFVTAPLLGLHVVMAIYLVLVLASAVVAQLELDDCGGGPRAMLGKLRGVHPAQPGERGSNDEHECHDEPSADGGPPRPLPVRLA